VFKDPEIATLPPTGLVRLSTILKVIQVGKSSWWQGVKDGRFPQSLKLGPRTTVWRAEDIRKLIADGVIKIKQRSEI
jgi:prophage regulatory protein